MGSTPLCEINLGALRHNFGVVKKSAPQTLVMAVIKANAYGHGIVEIAHELAPLVDALAVARLNEAVMLRRAGINCRIVVLEGHVDEADLLLASQHSLDLTIHHRKQVELLDGAQLEHPLVVWLKVDTGMNRLGFMPREAVSIFEVLSSHKNVQGNPRLMTHLANADDLADEKTSRQLSVLDGLADELKTTLSIANSAGILGWPKTHADWVRPGLMLYGASPLLGQSANELDLQPVMTLSASLISIRYCQQGDTVGYGGTFICPDEMPIGVVSIGYGDGYPRQISEQTPVLIRGREAPIVGRVSMDMLTIDLSRVMDASIGDRVTLWGEGLPIERIAESAGNIPYTLMCGVTNRVEKRYIQSENTNHVHGGGIS